VTAPTTGQQMTRGSLPAALTEPSSSQDFDVAPVLAFLSAAAHARGGVLSVPVAWNCLAFEYDLSAQRYLSDLIDVSSLPTVALGAATVPLPTGALVALTTGSGPVHAEVVHREGAHAALDADGTCPAWLSGAPAGANDPALGRTALDPTEATASGSGEPSALQGPARRPDSQVGVQVDELLVLDAYALGADQPERLRRLQGKWLDDLGHCRVRTQYRTAELAEQPETRQYAQYLVEQRSELAIAVLERAGARPAGSEWLVGELIERLQTSLLYVDELLTLAGLTRWRDQAIEADVFAAQLDDDARDDLRRAVLGWGRRALPRRGRYGSGGSTEPVYVALGVHLRDTYASSAPQKVTGRAYPAMLAAASGALTEHMEQSGRAVLVEGQRIHVRLDDAWQGGGIWRTEVVHDADSLDEVDVSLSLGWFTASATATPSTTPPSGPPGPDASEAEPTESDPAEPEPAPTGPASDGSHAPDSGGADTPPAASGHGEPEPDPGAEPAPVGTRSDATTCLWTFALTSTRQRDGVIPLTAVVADRMAGAGLGAVPVRIVLSHPGTDIKADLLKQSVTMNGRRLEGVRWPAEMFVGLRLTASWIVEGNVIAVMSTPLDEPKICDGIPLDYDFDEEVVLRSWGAPLDLDVDDPTTITRAQVLQLLRRHARRVDGAVPLTLVAELPLLQSLAADAGISCPIEQVVAAVDALTVRSTMQGSVLVQWARWTDAAAGGERYQRPRSTGSRAGVPLQDLAVLLSLAAKPSGAPSRAPQVPKQADVAGSLRRGHLRWTGGPVSAERQAMAQQYAQEIGVSPDHVHPYQTYVRPTRVKAYRRGMY
jgi:hypothetical protein